MSVAVLTQDALSKTIPIWAAVINRACALVHRKSEGPLTSNGSHLQHSSGSQPSSTSATSPPASRIEASSKMGCPDTAAFGNLPLSLRVIDGADGLDRVHDALAIGQTGSCRGHSSRPAQSAEANFPPPECNQSGPPCLPCGLPDVQEHLAACTTLGHGFHDGKEVEVTRASTTLQLEEARDVDILTSMQLDALPQIVIPSEDWQSAADGLRYVDHRASLSGKAATASNEQEDASDARFPVWNVAAASADRARAAAAEVSGGDAWDVGLHARLELPASERAQIEARLDEWAQDLLRVGPALPSR